MTFAFWGLLVVMIVACTTNTAIRVKRREEILKEAREREQEATRLRSQG